MNSEVIDGFFQAMSSGDVDAAEKFFDGRSELTDTATGMTMRAFFPLWQVLLSL